MNSSNCITDKPSFVGGFVKKFYLLPCNLLVVMIGSSNFIFIFISYLYVDTSFSSIDHELSMSDTNLWKMTQSEKLQTTNITPREITKRLHDTCPQSTHRLLPTNTVPAGYSTLLNHCTVPGQVQPYWITAQCPVNQRGLFNCGVHDNFGL